MSPTGPVDLLRKTVAAEPSRPLVTFYDDASGERVELSGTTFDNWVAKTANLLVDGLDARPGTRVVLALPPHWQTAAWLFACWSAGLVAVPVEPDADLERVIADCVEPSGASEPYLLVTAEERLAAAGAAATAAEELVGLSLHALGAPLRDHPPGVVDYAAEVRSYGDRFVPSVPVDPDALALVMMNRTFTGAEVVLRARGFSAETGLKPGARVLTDLSWGTVEGLFAGLLSPLDAAGSVIICRNLAKSQLDRRISLEHVTAIAGLSGWVEPSGSVQRLA